MLIFTHCGLTTAYPGNVAARCSDAVDSKTNATGRLGNVGTCLERVVDALDAVLLHADQETGRHLGAGRTGVEEGGGCMCEPAIRHQVVSLREGGVHGNGLIGKQGLLQYLNSLVNFFSMDTHGYSHQHVLRTLSN